MHHWLFGQEQIFLFQLVDDEGIGFPDSFVVKPLRGGVVEAAVGKDGAVDVEFFADAGFVVVFAMAGGCVHEPGAVGGGDVIGGDDAAVKKFVEEGMFVSDADEIAAEFCFGDFVGVDTRSAFKNALDEI